MKSFATAAFWRHYRALPVALRHLALKNYRLWKENPRHPSLHFKKVGAGIRDREEWGTGAPPFWTRDSGTNQ